MDPSNRISKGSQKSLKLTVLTGFCTAVSAALGFALMPMPNIELLSASIFLSGLLLGPLRGFAVGIAAEFIYTLLNPMGISFPPMMIAQIACMGVTGISGGLLGKLTLKHKILKKGFVFGSAGLLLTLNYQFWVNFSVYYFAVWDIEGAFFPYLISGILFSLMHLVSNTIIFTLIVLPAAIRLKTHFTRLIPLTAAVLIFLQPHSAFTSDFAYVMQEPDSSEDYIDYSVPDPLPEGWIINPNTLASQPQYTLKREDWERAHYQDTADIMRLLPGYYHYDLALPGQPQYLFSNGGMQESVLFGMPMNSYFDGGFDYLLASAGYLSEMNIYPGAGRGLVDADGIVEFVPEVIDPEMPYSRIDYRDGYYGFGVVDFTFAQRLREQYGFQLGGRVSEFNGRFANSDQSGEQFRSTAYWYRPDYWNVQFTYLNHHNKAGITHSYDRRAFVRNDFFLIAKKAGEESSTDFTLHYYNTEDDFLYKPDPIERAVRFKASQRREAAGFSLRPSIFADWYWVEAGGFSETQPSLSASLEANKEITVTFSNYSAVKLDYRDEFLFNLSTVFDYQVNSRLGFASSASRSGKFPAPLYRVYDLTASDIFRPGSPAWALSPGMQIEPNYNLKAELTDMVDFNIEYFFRPGITLKTGAFYKIQENPVALQPAGQPDTFTWYNASDNTIWGVNNLFETQRFYHIGMRAQWTYHHPELLTDFIPQNQGVLIVDYRNLFYEDELDFTAEIHGVYLSPRKGYAGGIYSQLEGVDVWGIRFKFMIKDFTLFWGNENIFAQQYEIIPGYKMIHREEVWGVHWVFWN